MNNLRLQLGVILDPIKRPQFQLFAVLVLALLIRLTGINSKPIWYDEAFSILYSETGPSGILAGTLSLDADSSSADVHPPLYYFTLWGWMRLLGSSLISVRLLSILAGMGIVAITYRLGTHWFSQRTAIAATILVAFAPFQVHYAQEIRMYGFAALFLGLAFYCLQMARQTGRTAWWLGFAVLCAFAQYTHNLSVFFLITFIIPILLSRDIKIIISLVCSGLVALVIYLPWLVWLPSQFANIQRGYWILTPGPERLFTLFLVYLPNLPVQSKWLLPILFLSTFIIALAIYQTFVIKGAYNRQQGMALFYFSFAPPFLIWLVSQVWPVYLERSLLPAHVFFCLWLAWVISETRIPRVVTSALIGMTVLLFIFGLFQNIANSKFPYADYTHLAEYLRNERQSGDLIIHSNKLTLLPSLYFDRSLPQTYIEDQPGSKTDTLSPATIEVLDLHPVSDIAAAVDLAPSVWFIIFQESVNEYTATGYPTHTHLAYLNEKFEVRSITYWNDLLLYEFQRRY
jgi:4-amino-4-deoxy-L-arabinose transferase-like glycosyltransferase